MGAVSGMLAGLALAGPAAAADKPDNWNYPNAHYYRCVPLRNPTAPLRFSDYASLTGYSLMQSSLVYSKRRVEKRGYCSKRQARLDAHEALSTKDKKTLYFHKGGKPGYANASTPYGHLSVSDIVRGRAPKPLRPTGRPPEYGIPSAIGSGRWDQSKRNGRGCRPTAEKYRVLVNPRADAPETSRDVPTTYNPNEIPPTWQYKPGQTSTRYNKYANAGEEQDRGTAARPVGTSRYAYLLWSWLTRGDGKTISRGGGMVRALIRPDQVFYRCDIASINSNAYERKNLKSTPPVPGTRVVGRVTAIYGATQASANSPMLYGWAIQSHRAISPDGTPGPRVLHMQLF